VKQSIATSKKAGIRVIMITGDHVETATAIAKDLGIINAEDAAESRAMQGFEVDLLSEEVLSLQSPFPVVFARVSPDNKMKIVKALQRNGQIVVMTGDGVNDAPAIKQADVGVAMGITGTEITKQAADIVLATDDFTAIVVAVKEGRQVYDNILKFVVYLLSCNAAEVFLFLACVSVNLDLPLTTIQILWANIFADSNFWNVNHSTSSNLLRS
jgi:P-type Ca2+ transporter type 2C